MTYYTCADLEGGGPIIHNYPSTPPPGNFFWTRACNKSPFSHRTAYNQNAHGTHRTLEQHCRTVTQAAT